MQATLRHRILTSIAAAAILLAAPRLLASPPAFSAFPVGDDAGLRAAILAAGDGDTITFTGDITLTADLPAVQTSITVDGQGHTLSGNDQFRGFFIGRFSGTAQVAVTVGIHDLTITLATAHGGNGGWGDQVMSGGGGAGLGGAIFVANLANLTIANVVLDSNIAEGGAGGVFSGQPGISAAGDVNGDGVADLVLGSGGVSAPFVQVVSGASGAVLRDFYAYDLGFTAGVYVAAADVTGDGFADIVTGAGPGGGPHVRVFDGVTGAATTGPLAGFMAYDPAFRGGVRVAAGDLNGDGRAEVITGPGPGGGPHVRVWDGASATEIFGVLALDPAFTGGVFPAGPPVTGRLTIDLASAVGGSVRVAGWALREGLGHTNGTDAVHVWAFPVGGGAPVFVGATTDRGARPDVAAALGGEFLPSGFDVTGTLAPGTYDLVVYVRNSRTLRFDQARVVRLTVN